MKRPRDVISDKWLQEKKIGLEYLKLFKTEDLRVYFIVAFLTAAAFFLTYQLWEVNIIKVPLTYSGDGLSGLASTKMMIEGGWGYSSDRLGAPFGLAAYDGLQNSYLHPSLKKIISLFSSNWIFVNNMSYLMGYIIIACITQFVLMKLDVDKQLAVVLSTLYACLPYHFMRGEGHASLSFYVVIPIAVYYAVLMMRGPILKNDQHYINESNVKFLLAMILIAIDGVYYAFFSCFFLCVAGLYILINEKKISRLKEVGLGLGIIIVSTIVGYLPNVLYTIKYGKNTKGIIRTAAELEVYGLKISQLIMPISGHRIPAISRIKTMYNSAYPHNENDMASLGLIFSLGFLILLLYFWIKKENKILHIHEIACLNLAALLYASVGGLISIQGLFFSMIRCSNRISVFIGFFSCVCIGVIGSDFLRKQKAVKKIPIVLLAFLLVFGILDQTRPKYINAAKVFAAVENDRNFVEEIEKVENGEGIILQLPVVRFPEAGKTYEMQDYAHDIGYLYSENLRWSYGVCYGRDGSEALDIFKQQDLSGREIIDIAAKMGYTGIYLDKKGFPEEKILSLEAELRGALQQLPIRDTADSKLYFSLSDYIATNHVKVEFCSTEFGEGIYQLEESGGESWRWADQEGDFRIYNWSDKVQKMILLFSVVPSQQGAYTLTVKGSDEEKNFSIISQEENFAINDQNKIPLIMEVTLLPGYNSFHVQTDIPLLQTEDDQRELSFQLRDWKVFGANDIQIEWKDGVYEEENENGNYWRWVSKEGGMVLENYGSDDQWLIFSGKITSHHEDSHEVIWSLNGKESKLTVHPGENEIALELLVHPGENELYFETNMPYMDITSDPRSLCFQFVNYSLVSMP